MEGEGTVFTTLLGYLKSAIKQFPDKRTGKNCIYTIEDSVLSAFPVFYTQFPSFLHYQQMMQENKGNNNARTIFGVHEIPSYNCIRQLLDPISPKLCFPIFADIFKMLY